jgi:hypothetical protein
VVEGTPLLRVQAGNRLEGSNPFGSANNPLKSFLFPLQQGIPPCFRTLGRFSFRGEATWPPRSPVLLLASLCLARLVRFARAANTGN